MTDVFPCEITGKTGKAAEVQLFWEGLWEGRAAGRWADVTSWWWGAIWFTCQDVNSFASFMSVFLCHSYWIEVCHLTLFLAEWHQHPLVGFACRAGLWAKWTDRKSGTEPGPRWASQSSRRGWSSSSVCAKFTLPHGLPSLAPAYSCSYHQLEHVGVWTCSHLSCPQPRNEAVAVWKAMLSWPGNIHELLSMWSSSGGWCQLVQHLISFLGCLPWAFCLCYCYWPSLWLLHDLGLLSDPNWLMLVSTLTPAVTVVLSSPVAVTWPWIVWRLHYDDITALYCVALLHLVFRVLLVLASHWPWLVNTEFGAVPLLQVYAD